MPNWGKRVDGTDKGNGWLGPIKNDAGDTMTELSMSTNIDGKEVLMPLLVPTLTQDEIDYLKSGGRPTKGIVDKAVSHALDRIRAGASPFKD